jgi:DNA-binding IclR family transcriptional regulator
MNQLKMYRCIKLMELLQGTPRQIYTIARYLGVSHRTVYRYFELFKELGYSIDKDTNNKYQLRHGRRSENGTVHLRSGSSNNNHRNNIQ